MRSEDNGHIADTLQEDSRYLLSAMFLKDGRHDEQIDFSQHGSRLGSNASLSHIEHLSRDGIGPRALSLHVSAGIQRGWRRTPVNPSSTVTTDLRVFDLSPLVKKTLQILSSRAASQITVNRTQCPSSLRKTFSYIMASNSYLRGRESAKCPESTCVYKQTEKKYNINNTSHFRQYKYIIPNINMFVYFDFTITICEANKFDI